MDIGQKKEKLFLDTKRDQRKKKKDIEGKFVKYMKMVQIKVDSMCKKI